MFRKSFDCLELSDTFSTPLPRLSFHYFTHAPSPVAIVRNLPLLRSNVNTTQLQQCSVDTRMHWNFGIDFQSRRTYRSRAISLRAERMTSSLCSIWVSSTSMIYALGFSNRYYKISARDTLRSILLPSLQGTWSAPLECVWAFLIWVARTMWGG